VTACVLTGAGQYFGWNIVTNFTVQVNRYNATNFTVQVNRNNATNFTVQVNKNIATNFTVQVNRNNATNLTVQVNRNNATNFTVQVNKNIATNFTVQVNRIMIYRMDGEIHELHWFNYVRRCISRFLVPSFILSFTISFIPRSSVFAIFLFIVLIANCMLIRINECYFTFKRGGRCVLNLIPNKNSFSTGIRAKGECLSMLFIPGIIMSNLQ